MSILFDCPHCHSPIRVRQEFAGKSGACPGCKKKVQVPAAVETPSLGIPLAKSHEPDPIVEPAVSPKAKHGRVRMPVRDVAPVDEESGDDPSDLPLPAPRRKKNVREKVLAGFQGSIAPVRRTILYRLAVVTVALVVLVLPVLYVALIGLLGWGVYWHATENTAIAEFGGRTRARVFAVLLYLAPIFAGSIAVLFMLKPLFVRMPRRFRQISLNRARQPLLFEFVERICDSVHAPRPTRIDLDLNINASAGFGSGMFRLVKSDLVLTIGMPLVAGLTLQQFAGVLAHEFGHFSQGAGMRMSWVIRSVNGWFARVVYLRDAADVWLVESSEDTDLRIGWFFYLARFVVFLSRGVLWAFMMASHAISCGLSRLMEYDADRYEARMAGSETFAETSQRLYALHYACEQFFRSFGKHPVTGNLVRDVVGHCRELDGLDEKRIRRRLRKEQTGWFDTHPSTADRIAAVEREDAPGIFHSKLPAEAVFHEFDELCLSLQRI